MIKPNLIQTEAVIEKSRQHLANAPLAATIRQEECPLFQRDAVDELHYEEVAALRKKLGAYAD